MGLTFLVALALPVAVASHPPQETPPYSCLQAKTLASLAPNYQEEIWVLADQGRAEAAQALRTRLEDRLRNEKIVWIEPIRGSTSPKWVILESGISGIYKNTPRYSHEIAAYILDTLLEFNHVPMTIERQVDHILGSFQFFYKSEPQNSRYPYTASKDSLSERLVFDYLIANFDRTLSNYLISPSSGRLVLIDHERGFNPAYNETTHSQDLMGTILKPEKLARMRSLEQQLLIAEPISPWLTKDQVKIIRNRIVRYLEAVQP